MRSCLKKTPKLRPTYGALLQHSWLAPLTKPAIIEEESDDDVAVLSPTVDGEEAPAANGDAHGPEGKHDDSEPSLPAYTVDDEVARWVLGALARRRAGLMGRGAKPALHAAPLDAVATPGARDGVGYVGVKQTEVDG